MTPASCDPRKQNLAADNSNLELLKGENEMRLKAFMFAILLAGGALTVPMGVRADPPVVPTLSCMKGNSDVALHLRVVNNGPVQIAKGKTIQYAYTKSAGGAEIKGSLILDHAIGAGQATSFLVLPQAAPETLVYQCTASVKLYQPNKPGK
jgi:hypothetical protein